MCTTRTARRYDEAIDLAHQPAPGRDEMIEALAEHGYDVAELQALSDPELADLFNQELSATIQQMAEDMADHDDADADLETVAQHAEAFSDGYRRHGLTPAAVVDGYIRARERAGGHLAAAEHLGLRAPARALPAKFSDATGRPVATRVQDGARQVRTHVERFSERYQRHGITPRTAVLAYQRQHLERRGHLTAEEFLAGGGR
jgi:hypothetical protein